MQVQQVDMRTLAPLTHSRPSPPHSTLCGDIKETGNTGAGLTRALQNLMGRQQPKYFNVRPSVYTLLAFSKMDDKVTNDNVSARPHAFEPRHAT